MKLNKNKLASALEIVKPGLANKEIIEQATSFAFLGDRVVTYNDEISLSHPIEGLNLQGAIQADNLYKFLNKLKQEDIEFTTEDNQIILTSGRAKAGLTLQSEVKLPLESDVAVRSKWQTLPEDFNKFVAMAMTSCSRDMSKAVLTCVHISKNGMVESSDNYRIMQCNLQNDMPVESFLLPAMSAAEVVKIKPTKIAQGKGWMHFQNEEETIISCRIINDAFPNVNPVLNIKDGIRLILPQTTGDVIERAMVFSKKDHALDESVEVLIQNRRLLIQTKSDSAWFEEDINMRYDGDPIAFAITPSLLRGILAETGECEINKESTKLKFKGECWSYLTMLRKK